MSVDRITLTVNGDLGADVRAAAEAQGVSVSAWLAGAARARLRQDYLRAALDEWTAEEGPPDETTVTDAVSLLQRHTA